MTLTHLPSLFAWHPTPAISSQLVLSASSGPLMHSPVLSVHAVLMHPFSCHLALSGLPTLVHSFSCHPLQVAWSWLHHLAPSGPPTLVHLSSCCPLTWSCCHQRQQQQRKAMSAITIMMPTTMQCNTRIRPHAIPSPGHVAPLYPHHQRQQQGCDTMCTMPMMECLTALCML